MSWIITPTGPASLGLLDQYGGAAASYSLRNLSIYNTSPVVRVRRSSDNTEQDFTAAQVTDGTLTTFCGAGDGFVRTWYDQSGNVRDATQTNTALQPTIVSSGLLLQVNGRPAISFNAAPFLTSTLQLAFPFSAFWTVYPNNNPVSAFDRFAGQDIGGQFRYGTAALGGWFNATVNGPALTGQAQHQNTWLGISNSLIQTAANGSSLTNTVAGFSITTSSFSVGRSNVNSPFNGFIQEGVVYLSNESSNRTAIEANINAHYAIY